VALFERSESDEPEKGDARLVRQREASDLVNRRLLIGYGAIWLSKRSCVLSCL
jgi:hypothetical protein